jgi:hypothetical protein
MILKALIAKKQTARLLAAYLFSGKLMNLTGKK